MLARSRKRRLLEGFVGTALLGAALAVGVAANNFFNPPHVVLPPAPRVMPTIDQAAANRAAQYRMAAFANPAAAAKLRAIGIDPATGYPIKK